MHPCPWPVINQGNHRPLCIMVSCSAGDSLHFSRFAYSHGMAPPALLHASHLCFYSFLPSGVDCMAVLAMSLVSIRRTQLICFQLSSCLLWRCKLEKNTNATVPWPVPIHQPKLLNHHSIAFISVLIYPNSSKIPSHFISSNFYLNNNNNNFTLCGPCSHCLQQDGTSLVILYLIQYC